MAPRTKSFGTSRAVKLTTCPDCAREVGVTRDRFNQIPGSSKYNADKWRIVKHAKLDRSPCYASRSIVSEQAVFDRAREDEVHA